jgi:Cu/Ag efflux protein CusF
MKPGSRPAGTFPGLLLVLLSATLVVGATDPQDTPIRAEGVVVGVDRSRGTVLVDHGTIEGLLRSARTEFPAEDVAILENVRAGDHIRFAVAPGSAGHGLLTITELHVQPTSRLDAVRLLPLAGLVTGTLLAAALVVLSIWIVRQLRRIRERDRTLLEQHGELRRSLTVGLNELTQGLAAVAGRLQSDMARVRQGAAPAPRPARSPVDRLDSLALVVVERGATETYGLLKERLGSTRARVIWDRRRADRRTRAALTSPDRRRRERRRSPPVTWEALGYLVAERAERHLTIVA